MKWQINATELIQKIGIVIGVVLVAILFGLVATTASPLVVTMAVGLVVGSVLIIAPKITITLLIIVGFISGVLASLASQISGKLPWAVALLGFSLFIPVLFSFLSREKKSAPIFIWVAIFFMIYSVMASLLNWESLLQFVAGFKRYFQMYGLMLALAFIPFLTKDIMRWKIILLAIGILQFPFALYELLVLVPQRGGLAAGSQATDVVAGTFGANLEGGSPNSVMVTFLLILFSFIFSQWRTGLLSTSRMLLLGFFLLLPLGFGETKIVIILIPIAWFVLIRHDFIKNPAKYLPVFLSGVFITFLLLYIYVVVMMNSTIQDVWKDTVSYNFQDIGYGTLYLNRTTVLSFWANLQGWHDPIGLLFGNGLGSSFWGDIPGHLGMKFRGYGIDLTTLSTLLWDVGVVGAILFILIFISAWKLANKIYRESDDMRIRADTLAIQAALSMFFILLIYSKDMVNLIGMEIIVSIVLGYLALIYRNHTSFLALGLKA